MPKLIQRDLWLSFDEQCKLLNDTINSGDKLSEILNSCGFSYDDFRYKRSFDMVYKGIRPLSVYDFHKSKNNIPFISFFTGCGGIDLGFEAAGFEHIASFEINEIFCKTLRRNRPLWDIFGPPTHNGDVSKMDEIYAILSRIISKPFDGIFVGGPPCQPFSIASNQRFSKSGKNFKRTGFENRKDGNLLFDYIALICEFKPRIFIVENVSGLKDIDGGKQLSDAIGLLEKNGYTVTDPLILDASDYGVPQNRVRLFVIGSQTSQILERPKVSDSKIGAGSVLLNNALSKVCNHETRQHNASSVLRYMFLDYGSRDKLGRVDRLNPTLPSKTVIAGGSNGGGRSHLHPEIPRTLSVRESARLQTFPDDYVFTGSTARQFTQVGNAVPPVLAAQLAEKIRETFF